MPQNLIDASLSQTYRPKGILKIAFSAYEKTLQVFKCSCLSPCTEKSISIAAIHKTPAKIDLTLIKAEETTGLGLRKSGCTQPLAKNKFHSLSANVGILLFKQEESREESIRYTSMIALADVYNTIGLFFGVCVLSMYDTLEGTLISFLCEGIRGTIESKDPNDTKSDVGLCSLTPKVLKLRNITGHEIRDIERLDATLFERLTTVWFFIWTALAIVTTQQVCSHKSGILVSLPYSQEPF